MRPSNEWLTSLLTIREVECQRESTSVYRPQTQWFLRRALSSRSSLLLNKLLEKQSGQDPKGYGARGGSDQIQSRHLGNPPILEAAIFAASAPHAATNSIRRNRISNSRHSLGHSRTAKLAQTQIPNAAAHNTDGLAPTS